MKYILAIIIILNLTITSAQDSTKNATYYEFKQKDTKLKYYSEAYLYFYTELNQVIPITKNINNYAKLVKEYAPLFRYNELHQKFDGPYSKIMLQKYTERKGKIDTFQWFISKEHEKYNKDYLSFQASKSYITPIPIHKTRLKYLSRYKKTNYIFNLHLKQVKKYLGQKQLTNDLNCMAKISKKWVLMGPLYKEQKALWKSMTKSRDSLNVEISFDSTVVFDTLTYKNHIISANLSLSEQLEYYTLHITTYTGTYKFKVLPVSLFNKMNKTSAEQKNYPLVTQKVAQTYNKYHSIRNQYISNIERYWTKNERNTKKLIQVSNKQAYQFILPYMSDEERKMSRTEWLEYAKEMYINGDSIIASSPISLEIINLYFQNNMLDWHGSRKRYFTNRLTGNEIGIVFTKNGEAQMYNQIIIINNTDVYYNQSEVYSNLFHVPFRGSEVSILAYNDDEAVVIPSVILNSTEKVIEIAIDDLVIPRELCTINTLKNAVKK